MAEPEFINGMLDELVKGKKPEIRKVVCTMNGIDQRLDQQGDQDRGGVPDGGRPAKGAAPGPPESLGALEPAFQGLDGRPQPLHHRVRSPRAAMINQSVYTRGWTLPEGPIESLARGHHENCDFRPAVSENTDQGGI